MAVPDAVIVTQDTGHNKAGQVASRINETTTYRRPDRIVANVQARRVGGTV